MPPSTASRALSFLLQFFRNNSIIRLLRRIPSIFIHLFRLTFRKASTGSRLPDNHSPALTEKCDPPNLPTICASRVPNMISTSQGYLPSPASPSSSEEITINVEQCDDGEDTLRSRDSFSMHSLFDDRRQSTGSVTGSIRSLSPQIVRPQQHGSVVSFNGGLSARALHASSSRLSLNSVHSSVHSIAHSTLTFNGDRASIRQSTIDPQIDCMLSVDLSRYLRKHKIPQEKPNVTIRALETKYACPIPEGWTKYVHPDGCPYWYDTKRKVLTDVNLLDKDILYQTHRFVDIIFDYIRAENLQLEPDVELVVETVKYDWDDDYRCGYYFVHHNSRNLFWLQDFDVSYALWDAHANTSLSHVKLEIEVSYWQHWELFCNIQVVTEDLLNELTNILITDLVDLQTSDTSNALFSANELQSYLGAVKISRRLIDAPCKGSPFFIGRLMSMYMRQRFANFWGEYGARLHREQSVHHPEGRPRTWLITLLSPILFNAPDIHLRGLHLIFIDEVAAAQPWRAFIKKLNDEWQDFIINSAVLLAANVAFLAIQSVDNEKDDPRRSPSQIASYLSTITSVSSMIVGLLLVRQNRTKGRDTARAAADYLCARQYHVVGHEPLAIMYSLPYAFLMWAMVLFMIAFLLACLLDTTLITRLFSGITGLICLTLIFWCIWMNWDRGVDAHESQWNNSIDTLSQWRARLHEALRSLPFRLRKQAQSQDPEDIPMPNTSG
ncbi:WW domain-containing protein [Pleurotus pulmonarius]